MKIFDYIKSLVSGVNKVDLTVEIDGLASELEKFTLPVFEEAVNMGLNTDGNNYYLKQISRLYQRQVLENRLPAKDAIAGTYRALTQLAITLPWLKDRVAKEYRSGEVTREAMDLRQANLLRYIESADFFIRYARSMLLVVTAIKSSGSPDSFEVKNAVSMTEVNFLTTTAAHFMYLLNIFTNPVNVTARIFDAIPTIVVDEDSQDIIESTMGNGKIDPINAGFIPLKFNIFFLMGRRRAERRVKRLKAAELEARSVELHLNKLREQKQNENGESDPAIDKQIEYNMARLQRLQHEIETIQNEG